MLIYHPSKDANHTAYRIISILESLDGNMVSRKLLSFLDFYYLFPSQLKQISKWPRKGTKNYKIIQNIKDEYEIMENPRRIFYEISEIFNCTISFLLEKNILINCKDNILKLNLSNLPSNILNMLDTDSFRKSEAFRIITKELVKQELKGKSGLKMKTSLMEYQYD